MKTAFTKIGRLTKAHGIKGELNLLLDAEYLPESGLPECFFVLKNGSYLPYFTEALQTTFDRNAIIKFEELKNRTMAEPLAACDLYLYNEQADEHFLFDEKSIWLALKAYKVYDKDVFLARVHDVFEINAQFTIELIINEKEVLIPLADEFIIKLDRRKKELFLNLPDGLLELYL